MAIENVKEILEKLMADPKAQELFKGLEPPRSEEEKALKLIEAAKKLGYDLDAADLADYLKKAASDRKEKTDAQAEAIQKLDDSELEKAAGGRDHGECQDTFQDKENCWRTDACDLNYEIYPGYLCNHNLNDKICALDEMANCQEILF
ncbi:MAG: hypothetical protein IK099_10550 [Clostridia bacterium]|nr:hypothetical protein [Clostridia bacterium]